MNPQPDKNCEPNIALQKGCFRIDSNNDIPFSLVTDNIQGIMFTKDGKCHFRTPNTSNEVVGSNIRSDGSTPAKIITAENGDIVLHAKNGGNIVLMGANIKIYANDANGGQVVIDSTKMTQITSPIANIQGEKVTVSASSEASFAGGTTSISSQISTETAVATDLLKTSFFGKILSAIKKFSEFFSSICG